MADVKSNQIQKKGLKRLLEEYSEDDSDDKDLGKKDRELKECMGTSPKRDIDRSPKRDDGNGDGDYATLMVVKKDNKETEPLHDLTYVEIDTCSARSISCDQNDFIDLQLLPLEESKGQLRGVGGDSSVSGRETLVFYVKDIDGKMKAIIEPQARLLYCQTGSKISNSRATKNEEKRVVRDTRLR